MRWPQRCRHVSRHRKMVAGLAHAAVTSLYSKTETSSSIVQTWLLKMGLLQNRPLPKNWQCLSLECRANP
jgi:hypothetical protein